MGFFLFLRRRRKCRFIIVTNIPIQCKRGTDRQTDIVKEREVYRQKKLWDNITKIGQVNPESNTLKKFILFYFLN